LFIGQFWEKKEGDKEEGCTKGVSLFNNDMIDDFRKTETVNKTHGYKCIYSIFLYEMTFILYYSGEKGQFFQKEVLLIPVNTSPSSPPDNPTSLNEFHYGQVQVSIDAFGAIS
jgi:hypothetical protein